ncbi:hypothetical protein Poly30_08370 [Planctomycetes bacterium Poly30]|uniref:DUF1800 domain-containing protein n=1 Tax=Saltatorellus ferox TaxID=2528018 RepID=A0A518EMM2_9BACT|nr:hypothetical protein Poly30_08370 [Planctomycetes bacterium Poly30]
MPRFSLPSVAPRQDAPVWDRAAAAHVLRRVGFGGDETAVTRAVEAGFESTLAELENRRDHAPSLVGPAVEKLVSLGNLVPLQSRWMSLILGDGAPLLERVTLMWHGHFATSNAKLGDVRMMHVQNELFRSKGLGDFRELFHAVAKDPAMLVWLDGNQNRVGAPNENFAREVMELFGLGIQGGYTEKDIQEAARAFSGWSVAGRAFEFRAEHHDKGEKKLFGRGGVYSGEQAIDRVLEHPSCPRWIAWRLLDTFVKPDPEEALVQRVADVLVEEKWHIGRTLGRLFRDPVFLSREARRARIAGPVELVVGLVLATRAEIPPVDAVRAAGVMGQTLFMPPTVKGWDGGRAWIDPGTWLARHNWLTDFALAKGLDAAAAFGPAKRTGAVDAVCRVLVPEGIDDSMRAALQSAADSAHSDGHALHKVAALVITSPEYHLV